MKATLLLLLLLALAANVVYAQCGNIPPCWPSDAEGVSCVSNGNNGCQNPNTPYCHNMGLGTAYAEFDVTYYDPELGQYNSCVATLYQCDSHCPTFNLASNRRSVPKQWQPDFTKIFMGMLPHFPHFEWTATGRYGKCQRISRI